MKKKELNRTINSLTMELRDAEATIAQQKRKLTAYYHFAMSVKFGVKATYERLGKIIRMDP